VNKRVAVLAANLTILVAGINRHWDYLPAVICPQGQVSITKIGDKESASCSQTHGPALALCVRP
jgi:hypothetical protein